MVSLYDLTVPIYIKSLENLMKVLKDAALRASVWLMRGISSVPIYQRGFAEHLQTLEPMPSLVNLCCEYPLTIPSQIGEDYANQNSIPLDKLVNLLLPDGIKQ
ncbi:hypothetical protein LTR37_017682 [Vermiconidia calcicola]|uniref:Uncharacterized protein n=1 Tax=Vermiconidia calcicola TaxID=1690605 RepID=A0ACC3MKI8_9PEZI|nr:hypothetical protein LTR37_017682 [Vermiconidia calcicola]